MTPTQSDDLLSPLSRVEKARKYAMMEQRERIKSLHDRREHIITRTDPTIPSSNFSYKRKVGDAVSDADRYSWQTQHTYSPRLKYKSAGAKHIHFDEVSIQDSSRTHKNKRRALHNQEKENSARSHYPSAPQYINCTRGSYEPEDAGINSSEYRRRSYLSGRSVLDDPSVKDAQMEQCEYERTKSRIYRDRDLRCFPSQDMKTPRQEDRMTGAETVEGKEILSTLLATSTPRFGRKFLSESRKAGKDDERIEARVLTYSSSDSESADCENYNSNRLVPPRSNNSHVSTTQYNEHPGYHKNELDPDRKFSDTRSEWDESTGKINDRLRFRGIPKDADREDSKHDEPTPDGTDITEKPLNWQELQGLTWTHLVAWFIVAFLCACAAAVLYPVINAYWTPALPYCASKESDYAYLLADDSEKGIGSNPPRSWAVQLYQGDATCRRCPLYGICENGHLRTCVLPFELKHGTCSKSDVIEHEFEQVAASIRHLLVRQVSIDTCNISLTDFMWDIENARSKAAENATSVSLHSIERYIKKQVKELASEGLAHERDAPLVSLTSLPPKYVVRRALDLAISKLDGVTVQPNENVVFIPQTLAPLICRGKLYLFASLKLIITTIIFLLIVALLRQRWVLKQTNRALVERLWKEVRACLMARATEAETKNKYVKLVEPYCPVSHIRDILFDSELLTQNKKRWLQNVIWPKVVHLVEADSHILKSRAM